MKLTHASDPFGFGSLDDIFRAMKLGMDTPTQHNAQVPQSQAGRGGHGQHGRHGHGGKGLLGLFGVDHSEQARQGTIDPDFGRDKEITRVIEILNRRTQNNPVLIGEAGVGQTAVVEGLALKIEYGDVPAQLQDRHVIRLDVVTLVTGTGIRGTFEQRMTTLIDELKTNKNINCFIDEIHEIVGAGNAEGGMDAGHVLKPALARGELTSVGDTTRHEYRLIEKDSALARRLLPVMVEEQCVDETIKILKGLTPRVTDFHHVKYTEGAIEAADTH